MSVMYKSEPFGNKDLMEQTSSFNITKIKDENSGLGETLESMKSKFANKSMNIQDEGYVEAQCETKVTEDTGDYGLMILKNLERTAKEKSIERRKEEELRSNMSQKSIDKSYKDKSE